MHTACKSGVDDMLENTKSEPAKPLGSKAHTAQQEIDTATSMSLFNHPSAFDILSRNSGNPDQLLYEFLEDVLGGPDAKLSSGATVREVSLPIPSCVRLKHLLNEPQERADELVQPCAVHPFDPQPFNQSVNNPDNFCGT